MRTHTGLELYFCFSLASAIDEGG